MNDFIPEMLKNYQAKPDTLNLDRAKAPNYKTESENPGVAHSNSIVTSTTFNQEELADKHNSVYIKRTKMEDEEEKEEEEEQGRRMRRKSKRKRRRNRRNMGEGKEERKSKSQHGAEQHCKTNASIRNSELARPGHRAWAFARALRARARPFRGRSVVQSFQDFPRAPHAFQGASEILEEASERLRGLEREKEKERDRKRQRERERERKSQRERERERK